MSTDSSTTIMTDSFSSRLKNVLKVKEGWVFKPAMRRSFLILALYEAKRCILPRFSEMKRYERVISIICTAIDLIYTIDFLTDEEKASVASLTVNNHTKPCIAKITCADRDKQIREVVLPDVEKLLSKDKHHEDICDDLVQKKYQEITGKTGVPPPLWELRNLPMLLTYRMYYNRLELYQDIFTPVAPRAVELPSKKPEEDAWMYAIRNWKPADGRDLALFEKALSTAAPTAPSEEKQAAPKKAKAVKGGIKVNHKKRLGVIMEVKSRLEILEEMQGIFPEKRMAKEMRLLFVALPPPLDASQVVVNRHAAHVEAQLRVGLLKKMKHALPSKKFANEMKKLYLGLPPLPVQATKVAKLPKASMKKEDKEEPKSELNDEEGWEDVDQMKDVNAAVDGMELV